MIRINSNIFPKGGFVFKTTDGTTIQGSTWSGVVARLREYRKRNNLPPGDPDNEVRQQACERNPGLCTQDDGQHAAMVKIATLKGRILQWFGLIRKRMATQPLDFVSPDVANQRLNVCLGCEHNKELTDSGCSSCKKTVKELENNVKGGRKSDSRFAHRGCNVTGEHLATSAWIDQVTVDNPELPAYCWRKKTL